LVSELNGVAQSLHCSSLLAGVNNAISMQLVPLGINLSIFAYLILMFDEKTT